MTTGRINQVSLNWFTRKSVQIQMMLDCKRIMVCVNMLNSSQLVLPELANFPTQ